MALNNLSRKAWMKLSKNVFAKQKTLKALENYPLSLNSFFLGKIRNNYLIEDQNIMPIAMINDEKVKLIELLTCEDQIVFDPNDDNDTKRAVLSVNRQFYTIDQNEGLKKITSNSMDLILTELSHYPDQNINLLEYKRILKPKAYMAIIVSDYRDKSGYCLVHAKVASDLKEIGFSLHGLMILIKESQKLKPYGYPSTFVPNIINQFVVIARKVLN